MADAGERDDEVLFRSSDPDRDGFHTSRSKGAFYVRRIANALALGQVRPSVVAGSVVECNEIGHRDMPVVLDPNDTLFLQLGHLTADSLDGQA